MSRKLATTVAAIVTIGGLGGYNIARQASIDERSNQ